MTSSAVIVVELTLAFALTALYASGKEFNLEVDKHTIPCYQDIKLNTGADWRYETEEWYKPEEMQEDEME